jgi:hypothetical protein
MHEKHLGSPRIQRSPCLVLLALICAILVPVRPAAAQTSKPDPPANSSQNPGADSTPDPSDAAQQSAQPSPSNPAPLDTAVPVRPSHFLTFEDRFRLQAHTTFGPIAFLAPAGETAITMADPPHRYPREWSDGGAAFGRNYGSEFGRHSAGGVTHFGTAWIDGEDARYFRSVNHNPGRRVAHALFFTLFDRTNSGRRTLALSNFAGSAAAGFVGNLWEPDGFNDNTHALQRSALEFGTFGGSNLFAEFSPDLSHLMHKMHIPDRLADAILPRSY